MRRLLDRIVGIALALLFGTICHANGRLLAPPSQAAPGYKLRFVTPTGTWASYPLSGPGHTGSYPLTGTTSLNMTVGTGGADYNQPPPHFVGPGVAMCSGTITAEFYWDNGGNADNVPPNVVIVREYAEASWSGDPNGGQCDNDIAGSTTEGGVYGQTEYGVRYWAKSNPGTSFQVTISPSAYTSVSGNYEEVPLSGSCEVYYEPSVIVPSIALTGTTRIGSEDKILIGQRLGGSLNLGGLDVGSNQVSYSWSTSAGSPFKSYVDGQATAVYHGWSEVAKYAQSVLFYYARPSVDNKVTCDVSIPGMNLAFSVIKKNPVDPPLVTPFRVAIGTCRYLPEGYTGNPPSFRLGGGSIPEVSHKYGMIEVVWVETPSAYIQGSDKGQYCWTQMVEPAPMSNANNGGWLPLGQFSGWYLDGSHPYGTVGGYYVADGAKQLDDTHEPYFRDSPGFDGIDAIPSNSPPFQSYGMRIDDHFQLYVFYDPPGSNTNRVPLRVRTWNAYGEFMWTASGGYGTPSDNSSFGSATELPSHPEWSQVIH